MVPPGLEAVKRSQAHYKLALQEGVSEKGRKRERPRFSF
jgi:hypothetical protein